MSLEPSREAEGLQVVPRTDFPEAVPQYSSLEVAPLEDSVTPIRHDYSPESAHNGDIKPENDAWPESHESKGMISSASNVDNERGYTAGTKKGRMCGLRRLHFWLLAALLLVVVLAAVLGGVFGSRASHSDSSASQPPNTTENANVTDTGVFAGSHAQNNTGLALLSSGNSSVRVYYMDVDYQIIEAEYLSQAWLRPDGEPTTVTNVTSRAAKGSPIAAVAYDFEDGAFHRQLFFYDTDGLISTTNATNGGAWGEVYNPLTDFASYPGAKGLAACAGTNEGGLRGMRVYVANAEGYIQEIGFDFGSSSFPIWNAWMAFKDGSDPEAGVACNVVDETNHVYFRNKTTSLLHQWTWNYATDVDTWHAGPRSTNTPVADGGSIAVTSDGKNTDYLFFHTDSDTVVNGLFTGGSMSDFTEGVPSLSAAPVGYQLAAVWTDEATMINQNGSSPNKMMFSTVGRDGEARNGTVAST